MPAPPNSTPAQGNPLTGTPTTDERRVLLNQWIAGIASGFALHPETITPASSDASFRRYFRIKSSHAQYASLIIMDAPPQQEDCRPFISVAARFAAAGVNVPRVLEQNLDDGFLLLTDLGATTYLQRLDNQTAPALYRDACVALVRLQQHGSATGLPPYDEVLLRRELELFPTWYVERHCGHTLTPTERAALDRMFTALVGNNLAQPVVDVHRDYHSRNLMIDESGDATQTHSLSNPGILDFQDAVRGPITYDLVSLLRDAYVQWEEEQVLDWAIRYWEMARRAGLPVAADFADFWRDFEWMGLQRHLKVLGIFARLAHRDGKHNYLGDLPRVLHYTRSAAARYEGFGALVRLLDQLENRAVTHGYTF